MQFRKQFLVLLIGLASFFTIQAQTKYAVINTKYILDKIPEYKDADKKLKVLGDGWQQEIDAKMQEVDKLYKSYQAERAMLSDDMRKKREDEIVAKEKLAKDLQKQRFGYEGDLYKQRQILVKPIQDKVYNAIQKYAGVKGYDLVLDKAGGVTIFFADPKLDKSEEILKSLGQTK